jgi:hypothetical protein
VDELKPVRKALEDFLKFNPPRCLEQERTATSVILDFLLLKEDKIRYWDYAQRRWDIYHILSAIRYVLLFAFLIGSGFRVYYEFFVLQRQFLIFSNLSSWSSNGMAEFFAQIFIFGSIVTMGFLFDKERKHLFDEYNELMIAIIRRRANDAKFRQEIQQFFPDYF